jgi:rRNA-processing protein FCF1
MIDQTIIPPRENVKGIVIDSNLLLLFIIGLYDRKQIQKVRVVRQYTIDDFEKLVNIIAYYNLTITVTPNIITEICNLSDKLNYESKYKFFKFIEQFLIEHNEYSETSLITIKKSNTCFYKFGIADASVHNLAQEKRLVITDDFDLYHFLVQKGIDAINYNHLRRL